MDITSINQVPPPQSVCLRDRVIAKIAKNHNVHRARLRYRSLTDSTFSKPLPPLLNNDEPARAPIPSLNVAITNNRKTVNKAIRSHNWSRATNATLDMVSGEPQEVNQELMGPEQTSDRANQISRGPIVRYNKKTRLLEHLFLLKQQKHDAGQQLLPGQQASRPAADGASLNADDMLDRTYVVKDSIEPETTREIIQGLGAILHHIPFTIVGNAALVYYGRDRRIDRITLACPEDCVRAVFSWAQTHGMHRFQGGGWGDSFGYRTADGALYRVRVRALFQEPFNRIRLPRPRADNHAKVMTLPNLVNEYARLFAAGVRRLSGGAEGVLIVADILWMLRRIAALVRADSDDADDDQAFTIAEVTWVLTREFWEPFIRIYPEAIDLFRTAGVFRCVGLDAGTDCSQRLDKHQVLPPLPPLSPLPESMFGTSAHSGSERLREDLPKLQDRTNLDEMQPPPPYSRTVGKHVAPVREAVGTARSRAASAREAANALSSKAASLECKSWSSIFTLERAPLKSIISKINVGQAGRSNNGPGWARVPW